MKTVTVRLPEELDAALESESRAMGVSKSDVVRRRLESATPDRSDDRRPPTFFELASDLIGSVNDAKVPADLSSRKKEFLKKRGYGKNRHR